MTQPPQISVPAGYAAAVAVGYADNVEALAIVSRNRPLPVILSASPAISLQGTAAASQVAGPFHATPGGTVVVTLDGTWTGTVKLLRSTDGGVTKLPLRVGGALWGVFTQSGCEQAWNETGANASFYLDINLQTGAVKYEVSQ